MTRYAVLLRGVNVGGKQLPMADLRRILTQLGYTDVKTYLASGNAAVTSPDPADKVAAAVEDALESELSFSTRALAVTADYLTQVIDANPFAGQFEDPRHMHATFLFGEPTLPEVDTSRYKPERMVSGDGVLYFLLPNGVGRAALPPLYSERRIKTSATSRNWRTVLALRDLVSSAQ